VAPSARSHGRELSASVKVGRVMGSSGNEYKEVFI